MIRLDKKNTVKSLRDQLFTLTASGNDDSGFPILRTDNGFRMVGYIGANELEHALSKYLFLFAYLMRPLMNCDTGIVADEAEDEVHFHTTYTHGILSTSMSTSSLLEDEHHRSKDLYDFSAYMDQVSSTSDIDMLTKYS